MIKKYLERKKLPGLFLICRKKGTFKLLNAVQKDIKLRKSLYNNERTKIYFFKQQLCKITRKKHTQVFVLKIMLQYFLKEKSLKKFLPFGC